ncbi:MAG: conjugal transfer protein TraF [Armatimonadetes bacterium]|nr:conjugal transfer protein TraF [Armatimonadota bacterium]
MRKTLGWCAAFLAVYLIAGALPARADLSFGYEARLIGMGGAGLAIIDNPTQAALVNPAALSLPRSRRLDVEWPNFGWRVEGVNVWDALGKLSDFSVSASEALEMYNDFRDARDGVSIGVNSGMGLAVGPVDFRLRSQSRHRLNSVTVAPSGSSVAASADVFGATYLAPSVGFGFRAPGALREKLGGGDLHLGFRAKAARTYYNHWVVQQDTAGNVTTQQPTGADDRTSLHDTKIGLDVGLLWQPAALPRTTVAFTVNNLIESGLDVPSTAGVAPAGENVLPRTYNLGVAFRGPGPVRLAADILDVTGQSTADGKAQFRAGLDLGIFRVGYNQKSGFAAGVSLLGLSIAYAGDTPIVASQTFNF